VNIPIQLKHVLSLDFALQGRQAAENIVTTIGDKLARQLLDTAPDPTVIVDATGTIVYANVRVMGVLGYEPDELVGGPVEILLPERYRQNHVARRDGFFANPVSRPMGAALELYALRKDGREIPVTISLSPLQTESGMLVTSAIRDVTVMKQTERELVEANRAKSRFLAAASHDLRQPIQTLNLLNRAARSAATDDTHKLIIDKQQASLDSMARLLNALLDISKLEAGIVKPDIADCKVQNLFESLRAEFEDQAHDKGLELLVDSCHGVARSDPHLLTQILQNLVSNAIRYTKSGHVRLRCMHQNLKIRIEVLDTGLGIPESELDKIFDEFRQVDQGCERPEGLGLGLSIVKRTAELLNCPIDVRSSPGQGSVFSVTVPEGDQAAVDGDADVIEQPSSSVRGRVLVVDDEPAVAEATQMLLELEGFDVQTAASHDEVETILSDLSRAPEILVTDYHLRSGETGLDIIETVREQVGSDLPVVLVSGDTSDRVSIGDLERITFMKKPVDVDQLLTEIRQQLSRNA
jgi:PAS domain S-box-containing protein